MGPAPLLQWCLEQLPRGSGCHALKQQGLGGVAGEEPEAAGGLDVGGGQEQALRAVQEARDEGKVVPGGVHLREQVGQLPHVLLAHEMQQADGDDSQEGLPAVGGAQGGAREAGGQRGWR